MGCLLEKSSPLWFQNEEKNKVGWMAVVTAVFLLTKEVPFLFTQGSHLNFTYFPKVKSFDNMRNTITVQFKPLTF